MGIIGIIVGLILIAGGVVYAIVPYSIVASYGLDFGLDEMTQIIVGVVIVIIGFVVYWTAGKRKKTKEPKVSKIGK